VVAVAKHGFITVKKKVILVLTLIDATFLKKKIQSIQILNIAHSSLINFEL